MKIDINRKIEFDLKKEQEEIKSDLVKALNKAGFDASDELKKQLPDKFTIRKPWVQKGFRVKKGTKENIRIQVSHRDYYMFKQEFRADESPVGKYFTIPKNARRTPKSNIPKRMTAREILRRDGFFIGDAGFGGDGIYRRDRRSDKLDLMYFPTRRKKTNPIWNFIEIVEESVDKNLDKTFSD